MAELGSEPDLAQESLDAHQHGDLRAQHLDRNRAVVLQVMREKDERRTPAPQLMLDRVPAAQGPDEGGGALLRHGVTILRPRAPASWAASGGVASPKPVPELDAPNIGR